MTSLTSLPSIARLSSRVIRILGCNPGPMTLQGTNTYLIGTGDRRVLIDSGEKDTAPAYAKLLEKVLKEEKARIEHVIITHWHHDHIDGVETVQNLLKTTFGKEAKVWKLPRSLDDVTGTEMVYPFEWTPLTNGQCFDVDDVKLEILHTPGHSSDHVCLVIETDGLLFSGDCILGEGTSIFEDLHSYLKSLEKILQRRPKVIYPGHGPVIENPKERIEFYIEHRLKRESQILAVLEEHENKSALSELDIVKRLYKDTPETLHKAAAYNVGCHMEKLLKEEKVKGRKGEWFLNNSTVNKL